MFTWLSFGSAQPSYVAQFSVDGNRPIAAGKKYKVAGWAPVAEEAKSLPGVKPVWEPVETWLKAQGGRVKPRQINTPTLVATQGNPGMALT